MPFTLATCTVRRTLAEHEKAVLARAPDAEAPFVRQTIAWLVRAGLLLPETEDRAERSASERANGISTVAIITAERPRMLERCLESLLSHLERRGSTVLVLVVDGSATPAAAARNEDIVSDLGRRHGRSVEYFGSVQRDRLCRLLVAAGADGPLIRYAMGDDGNGPSKAGARNVMALATAGERVLVVEDDVVCTLWDPSVPEEHGLRLCGHSDPRVYRFFDSRSAVVPKESVVDADLLGAHERLLGRSVAELVERTGSCDTTPACMHLLATSADRGSRARVRVSMSGIAGEGLEPAYRLLLGDGGWKPELESSRDVFEIAMTCFEAQRIAAVDSITHDPACELVASAIDNVDPLPPFLPAGADRGRLFGVLLAMCDSKALFAHVPLGIVFDPDTTADSWSVGMTAASTVLASDVVLEVLSRLGMPSWRTDVSDRMRFIGNHVSSLGALSPEEFRDAMRTLMLERRSQELRKVEKLQDGASAYPPYWITALVRYKAAVLEALADPLFHCPSDLAGTRDDATDWQHAVGRFGELLCAWPEVWSLAAKLEGRESGVGSV